MELVLRFQDRLTARTEYWGECPSEKGTKDSILNNSTEQSERVKVYDLGNNQLTLSVKT